MYIKFLLASGFIVLGAVHFADAVEVMTDRCSAEVAIVPSYNALPGSPGTVILKRDGSGNTPWTPDFRVTLGDSGHIRWGVPFHERQHL